MRFLRISAILTPVQFIEASLEKYAAGRVSVVLRESPGK